MDNKGSDNRDPMHYTEHVYNVCHDFHDAEGGKGVLIQVGKLRCSARRYCGRKGEIPHRKRKDGAVLPSSPNENRTRHDSTGSLEVLRIPHT
jgi:hypothetical protein